MTTSTGSLIFDILVWINIYGIYILIGFVPSVYYIWLKIFSFPLITRKSHELLLMLNPENLKIKKIKSRELPFFKWKKGIYWFSEPFENDEPEQSKNLFHIYINGINQSLAETERRENKADELITYTDKLKALSNHAILFPKNLKAHMTRHWIITLEPISKRYKLTPVKERQNHRYSFYHTIGFQIQEIQKSESEIETENSSSPNVVFTQLTTQTILKKLKYIQEYSNFSSFFAYSLSRKIKRINSSFVLWILGSIDPRLLIILIVALGSIALVYFGMPLLTPKLGPMPT